MNKALILNAGGPGALYHDIVARAESWARGRGFEPIVFDLTAMTIKPCRGCFGCWLKTPGVCFTRDDMDEVIPLMAQADMQIMITPIDFGGYGFHLKKTLDRSIPILLPFFVRVGGELHHPLRYEYGKRRVAAIGVMSEPDAESERIFHTVVRRNSINMHAVPASIALDGNGAPAAVRWENQLDALFLDKEN